MLILKRNLRLGIKVLMIMVVLSIFCGIGRGETVDLTQNGVSFIMPDFQVELKAVSERDAYHGGGGGRTKDNCPDGDYSSSRYDGDCGTAPSTDTGTTETGSTHGSAERECSIVGSEYTDELNGAYQYACSVGITTMEPIQNADIVGPLLRKHLAKMVSEFAMNELGVAPDTGKVCEFEDMKGESEEMQRYAVIACQLGFMGLHSDGIQVKDNFDPNDQVIRAEFGTVLSRLLWGTRYATDDGNLFYKYHLEALRENGIMTQIYGDRPYSVELRGYVMLMLMRVAGLKGTETWDEILSAEMGVELSTGGTGGETKVDDGNMHVSFVGFKNGVLTTTGDYVHIIGALDPSQKVSAIRVTHKDTKGHSKITKYKLSKYEAATHYFWFNASKVNNSLTLRDKNTYEFEFYDANDKLLFKKTVMIIQK